MINKVLGLDLGSASIGWALVSEDSDSNLCNRQLIDLGVRIIPYNGTEGQEFVKGVGESKNALRTKARSARRGYDRYQLRRYYLTQVLIKNGMMPDDDLKSLPKLKLWDLRARAVSQKISLPELGRILLLLNQKRGYKRTRSDSSLDKKDTEYVAKVKNRYNFIKEQNLTIGQYFSNTLRENKFFRIKENVFPREAYIEEFNAICSQQKLYHSILTDELISEIRDKIIFYQRPLKSQKGLVSICEFEGFYVEKDGKRYFTGPKVAHRTSPLFQIVKIWESINNLRIKTRDGDDLYLTSEERREIFNHLDNNDKLSVKDLCKIIKKGESEISVDRKLFKTGLQGNTLKTMIRKACSAKEIPNDLLKFEPKISVNENVKVCLFSKKSGEVINESVQNQKIIDRNFESEPLYKIWHTIYSINDIDECSKALVKNFQLDEIAALKLANIDLSKFGYSNKSAKCLRKILPYLMDGYEYSESMMLADYNHSGSLTKDENLSRELADKLSLIPKNSLRQPIVEKILNQMVNLVNEIINTYGKPDEIRVELARELKQSKEERSETEYYINKRNRENEQIAKDLSEFGLRATRNNIIKYRLYKEINNEEKRLNAICIYCGKQISFTEAITGSDVDVEHIIPKAKLFDDSQSNKTLAHRHCNSTKRDQTAYDFMKGKSEEEFNSYVERVNLLFEKGLITKSKRDKLLMTESKIPDNFVDRQIQETRYISRKAVQILNTICHKVYCTSGTITAELRNLWGYNDVTMNLQLPKYKQAGFTEVKELEANNETSIHKKEIIKDWSKRDDHRHHAIDALVIACTKQGFIQRFNTLNSTKTREELEYNTKNRQFKEKLSLLEKYIVANQPFPVKDVEDAISKILISFKSGKKVITKGSRKIVKKGVKKVIQENIIIPRGALSEESVYGKIKVIEKEKPLKYLFENPDIIVKQHIREAIKTRLDEFNGDSKKALFSVKERPIIIKGETTLNYASCYKEEYVIKYSVDTNFNKVDKVIDEGIKRVLEKRLKKFNNKYKEAFKDVKTDSGETVKWYVEEGLKNPIHSVRCLTGLSAVVPIRKDRYNNNVSFVKPGNNHNTSIYLNRDGKLVENICTFWHAVERRKYNIPVIIEDPTAVWDNIQKGQMANLPETFLEQLPLPGSQFILSMQQNEMFILGLPEDDLNYAISNNDYKTLSNHLYRVQKIASIYYVFRHHLETTINDDSNSLKMGRFIRISSLDALLRNNATKVKVNILGKLTIDKKNSIY